MNLKVKKNELAKALTVLGKVCNRLSAVPAYRSLYFEEKNNQVSIMAANGSEVMIAELAAEVSKGFKTLIPYLELKAFLKGNRTGDVFLALEAGTVTFSEVIRGQEQRRSVPVIDTQEWPEIETPSPEAQTLQLPEGFMILLGYAAQVVNRDEARLPLRGINLSQDGITATDGKQLLNIPYPLVLATDITIPFPLPLLATQPQGTGKLRVWNGKHSKAQYFEISFPGWAWSGKLIAGAYPNWKQAIPSVQTQAYAVKLENATACIEFLKQVPNHEPYHAIGLYCQENQVTLKPVDFPDLKMTTACQLTGQIPSVPLFLNKFALLRLLEQGHHTLESAADSLAPVIATGGNGRFVLMPLTQYIPKEKTVNDPLKTTKEISPVRTINSNAVITAATNRPNEVPESVDIMDDLTGKLEDLRFKLKTLFEESAILTRKVKEAIMVQKQKEREFQQARRAIERIKLVSGF